MFLQCSDTFVELNGIFIIKIIKINKKVLSATWSLDVFCSKPWSPYRRIHLEWAIYMVLTGNVWCTGYAQWALPVSSACSVVWSHDHLTHGLAQYCGKIMKNCELPIPFIFLKISTKHEHWHVRHSHTRTG